MAIFKFTKENLQKADEILSKYPNKQAAIMPLLWLAQDQNNNWISKEVMDYIAKFLSIPPIRVYEIVTFYTMYNKEPVGKHLIQVCRTTPCWLMGSDKVLSACKKKLNINVGQTTRDSKFTLVEVECLGACVDAPVIQINKETHEKMTEDSVIQLIDSLN